MKYEIGQVCRYKGITFLIIDIDKIRAGIKVQLTNGYWTWMTWIGKDIEILDIDEIQFRLMD